MSFEWSIGGLYLKLSVTRNSDTRNAFTAVDAVTRDEADEKMLGH